MAYVAVYHQRRHTRRTPFLHAVYITMPIENPPAVPGRCDRPGRNTLITNGDISKLPRWQEPNPRFRHGPQRCVAITVILLIVTAVNGGGPSRPSAPPFRSGVCRLFVYGSSGVSSARKHGTRLHDKKYLFLEMTKGFHGVFNIFFFSGGTKEPRNRSRGGIGCRRTS